MLRLENVTVTYGRVVALRDLSLSVDQGELVAVVGPNGAGKSTAMLTIAGALKPAAGHVTLDGDRIDGKPPEVIAQRGVRLVPEGRHVFTQLTVEENLRLGATGRSGNAVEADIERELERFPILKRAFKANAGKLSGGEQQQLVIARALLGRPRLLLLDEPSLGLAPRMVDLVFQTIEALREEGTTILIVEQFATRAIATCDRTYIVQGGRIRAEGTRQDLDRRELENAYLGRVATP